ncbi:efflux RND transporter periplasmic adaptor subunit [Novosphingobium profundi]|uniref:efflux RND transporter periplasmic adaptor subunit n=1 Tax=Novosphingobium profundi TaxID=1774954 RepID=UPI001BD9CDFC|nr:efflux RND transporter periplasmic adaptor subunit [Novosphingobium profundi]
MTITVGTQPVPNIIEAPGRIEAMRTAEVRARTDGIVLRRLYAEGAAVTAGQPLFQIDPSDNRAQVQAAQANLQRALAARSNLASIVKRYEPLIKERAVSAQEYESAQSEMQQAEAQVAQSRAALDRAKLQMGYTTVRAPIAGRVGSAQVTEGALVSGAGGTLMTRVDQVSPVYAVFPISNAQILTIQKRVRAGEISLDSISRVAVKLVLEDGSLFGPVGHLDFAGTVIKPDTGSQTVRATFPNPGGLLRPGQFITGRMEAGQVLAGIVIPARAVQLKGEQASVSVLQKDGSVVIRPVTLGNLDAGNWIVRSGLQPGEKVIVEGWQKLRPGQKAKAVGAGAKGAPAPQKAQPQTGA